MLKLNKQITYIDVRLFKDKYGNTDSKDMAKKTVSSEHGATGTIT